MRGGGGAEEWMGLRGGGDGEGGHNGGEGARQVGKRRGAGVRALTHMSKVEGEEGGKGGGGLR